jgi:hypothetical protein
MHPLYCIHPILENLFLFLKSHIWLGPKFVTELGMSKGLCIRLLCVRVWLYCTLRCIHAIFARACKVYLC